MTLLDHPLSELRSDPICGRKVYIAEDRAGRPNDYTGVQLVERSPELCPFCVGHESETPAALLQAPHAGPWQVRVIPNKYPAVRRDTTHVTDGAEPPRGAHEVIVESPRHLRDITELSLNELTTVLGVYRDRLRHWSSDPDLRHATVFKNVGFAAGASLEHVHSQLVALPFVPEAIEAELAGARRHFRSHGECIYCRLLADERKADVRMVAEEGPFTAFCAYASRQPYELWILPTEHAANFGEIAEGELRSLASLLQQLLGRLRLRLENLSYNLLLHTLPFHSSEDRLYHWHWELVPRSSHLAGLEWGAGVHINPLSPERAARRLRDVR
jgi:UDPglucose--hexose-1-phosphate uridylyltransferase